MLFSVLKDIAGAGLRRAAGRSEIAACPVCAGEAGILGAVDFNKSCEDRQGMLLAKANATVRYHLCGNGHIAPGKGLDWGYLAPRNGHVSLFSDKSLTVLLGAHGFRVLHLNDGLHVAFREMPAWSRELSIFQHH